MHNSHTCKQASPQNAVIVSNTNILAEVYACRTPAKVLKSRTTRFCSPILLQTVKTSLSPNRTKAKAPPARKGLQVGYLRVSALDQKEVRQLDGVELDKRFADKVSGKDRNRPQLEQMIEFVREGDTVFCHSMDRLARNLDDLRLLVKKLTGKGVKVCFVKESLTFTGEDSPMANLLLSVMGAIAEFERELIKERQREGIAIAKKRGAYAGRKRTLTAAQAVVLLERIAAGESKTKLANELGVSRNTIYMYVSRGGK